MLAAIAAVVAVTAVGAQPNPYRTIDSWLKAPVGRTMGSVSSVDAAADGTLWVAERCAANDCSTTTDLAPIFHADASGNVIGSFGAGRFAWPHGIHVDGEGNVWVTDARAGNSRGLQVTKFAPDGRALLMIRDNPQQQSTP